MIPESSQPSVTVCILNWNCGDYLEACLSAIYGQSYANFEIILVDNGSTDGSVAFVRERFPELIIHETGRNLGYGAGNNVVLRSLTSDIALLLNPDVILSPDCLAQLVETMTINPEIGVAGCKLWYPGGEVLQHAGGMITEPQAFPGHFGIREVDSGQYDTLRDVDYVIGAAFAVRREALNKAGLFDEGIFLYFEDVDLCFRIRQAGYRVVYVPSATGIHSESATTQPGSFAYLHRFHKGRWYFLLKHFQFEPLIQETFPAEQSWIEAVGFMERRAAAIAYRATLYQLPVLAAARAREGAGPLPAADWKLIEQSLLALTARALPAGELSAQLDQLNQLSPTPFVSTAPVFGPLIARIRSFWNGIAGRWYVDHLRQQQVIFNRMVFDQLRTIEAELQSRQALIEEQMLSHLSLRERASAIEIRLRRQQERENEVG